MTVSLSEGGVASVPVGEGGVASVPVNEGGVASVSEGGVASVPVSLSEGGVAFLPSVVKDERHLLLSVSLLEAWPLYLTVSVQEAWHLWALRVHFIHYDDNMMIKNKCDITDRQKETLPHSHSHPCFVSSSCSPGQDREYLNEGPLCLLRSDRQTDRQMVTIQF